jgi:spermidine/putrescine transport system substrate-binding protein
VIQGSYANPDAMLAQIQAEGYDHYNFFTAAQEITPIQIARRGWNAELDEKKIPRLKDLIPYVVERNKTHGKGKLLSVPYYLSGGAIAYNTKTIDRAEIEAKGFGILLDTKYKGNMSGFDNWQYRIYYAALQSGQDHNDIKDFDAIWDKVRASKRQVLKYFTSGAEQDALLTSGNVVLTDAWFLSIYNLMKQGQPIDFWPRERRLHAVRNHDRAERLSARRLLRDHRHPAATGSLFRALHGHRQSAPARPHEVRVPQGAQGDARLQSDGRGHRLPHF